MPRLSRPLLVGTLLALVSGPGHAAINGWTFNGPPQGPIIDIAVHPTDPAIAVAGGNRTFFRSTDGGQSWSGAPLGPNEVRRVRFDRSNPNRIVALNTYVYLSDDGGVTFSALDGPLPQYVASGADFGGDGALYVTYFTGRTYKTVAPFTTWTELTTPWPTAVQVSDLETSPAADQTLFVTVESSGIWRSVDGGASWSGPLNSGFANSHIGNLNDIAINPLHPSHVYVAHSGGVHRSLDNGDTWNQVEGSPTSAIAFDPNDDDIVLAIRGAAPWGRSTDGGDNFSNYGVPLRSNGRPVARFVSGSSTRILFGALDGLSISTDGGATRAYTTTGITGGASARLVASDDGTVILGQLSGFNDLFRRAGSNYQPLHSSMAFYTRTTGARQLVALAVSPTNSNVIMAANGGWQLVRTIDGGNTFSSPAVEFTGAGGQDPINNVTIAPDDPNVAYVTKQQTGIWKTTDGGASYGRLAQAPTFVNVVAVHPANTSVLYASGGPENGSGIYKSNDGGLTWTQVLPPQPNNTPNGIFIYHSFAFHPELPGTVYAVAWGAVRKTVDGGANWTLVDFGPPEGTNPAITAFMIDPLMPSTLIALSAGATGGFLRSVDGGLTWHATPLEIMYDSNYLTNGVLSGAGDFLAGTNRKGVAEYTIASDLRVTMPDVHLLPQGVDLDTTLTVTNHGPHATSPTEVVVTHPAWLTIPTPTACTANAQGFRCPIAALNNGASVSIPLRFTPTGVSAGDPLTVTLPTHELDPLTTNNRIDETVSSAVLNDLDMGVTAPTEMQVGSTTSFVATLVNRGPSPASAVQLTITGLGSFVVESATTTAGTCAAGATTTCTIGTLAPNGTATLTLQLRGNTPGLFSVLTAATAAAADSDNDLNSAVNSIRVAAAPAPNPNPAPGSGGGGGGRFHWLALILFALLAAPRLYRASRRVIS